MNVFYFLLLAFFWGTAYVGVKYTVDVFDPYFSSFLRAFIMCKNCPYNVRLLPPLCAKIAPLMCKDCPLLIDKCQCR